MTKISWDDRGVRTVDGVPDDSPTKTITAREARLIDGLGELRRVITQIGILNGEIYPETVVIVNFIDNLLK